MVQNKKIFEIKALAERLQQLQLNGKTIVHCHGVFDLLHIGHIRYFEQAKQMGDILVVTATPDRFVDKGPGRPAFTEALRAEAIASIDSVDYVAINQWPTAEETLRILRPDIYVKGQEFKDIDSDRTGKIGKEAAVVEEIGAKIGFAGDVVFSSSNLINRYIAHHSEEIKSYLELFRQRYAIDDLDAMLEKMAGLKVLVLGDAILDEYQYCEAIGKSSKDPTLALKYQSHELFAGGVMAVANHVANFAGSVDLLTTLGEIDSQEEFIRSQLHEKVQPTFFVQPQAPTLTKRRFLDGYSFNKLLEVYVMDDSGLPAAQIAEMQQWLEPRLNGYDLVIVADFGHGTMVPQLIELLAQKAPFLAVNTQANAGNRGFNTISKYPRLDFACIAEHEMRLEVRDRDGALRPHMEKLAEQLGCRQFVVTTGRKGCTVASGKGDFVKVPTFAEKIVDRVGAGDAFFSVTALAAALDVPGELIGFLGNVVGSLAVEVIGNKKSIDRTSVEKYIVALMK